MGFEKFIGRGQKPTNKQPMVSVLSSGRLGINRACLEKYLKNYQHAELFFDPGEKIIGIHPTNEASDVAYPIRVSRNSDAGITALAFLRHFGIPHEKSKAYIATWNEKESMVQISLRGDDADVED